MTQKSGVNHEKIVSTKQIKQKRSYKLKQQKPWSVYKLVNIFLLAYDN
jgi:hypothetical protein